MQKLFLFSILQRTLSDDQDHNIEALSLRDLLYGVELSAWISYCFYNKTNYVVQQAQGDFHRPLAWMHFNLLHIQKAGNVSQLGVFSEFRACDDVFL